MIFAALSEAADRGELLLVDGGLCRFHLRQDGIVTIREILVLPERRRRRLATDMLAEIIRRHPQRLLIARCPVGYESNEFWPVAGFRLARTDKGVNVWERRPLFIAPTATPPSPVPP